MNTDHVPRPRKSDERDHVDGFLEDISADLPDHLDLTVEGIVDRIGGIHYRIKRMHNETLEELGLTHERLARPHGVALGRCAVPPARPARSPAAPT